MYIATAYTLLYKLNYGYHNYSYIFSNILLFILSYYYIILPSKILAARFTRGNELPSDTKILKGLKNLNPIGPCSFKTSNLWPHFLNKVMTFISVERHGNVMFRKYSACSVAWQNNFLYEFVNMALGIADKTAKYSTIFNIFYSTFMLYINKIAKQELEAHRTWKSIESNIDNPYTKKHTRISITLHPRTNHCISTLRNTIFRFVNKNRNGRNDTSHVTLF